MVLKCIFCRFFSDSVEEGKRFIDLRPRRYRYDDEIPFEAPTVVGSLELSSDDDDDDAPTSESEQSNIGEESGVVSGAVAIDINGGGGGDDRNDRNNDVIRPQPETDDDHEQDARNTNEVEEAAGEVNGFFNKNKIILYTATSYLASW